MSLPNLPAGDKFRREVRTEWGGLNLNENAGDGELIEAMNMSSREFPVLSTERLMSSPPEASIRLNPFVAEGKLGYILKNGKDSYSLNDPTTGGGVTALTLADTQINDVVYAQMRNQMIIFPGKKIYDFSSHSMDDMEKSWTSTGTVYFQDGEIYGETAENNTIYSQGANWASKFRAGDAVTISGCDAAANNKTAIIREISGDYLRFSENAFADGYWYQSETGLPAATYLITAGTETRSFTTSSATSNAGILRYHSGDGYVTYTYGSTTAVFQLDISTATTGTAISMNRGIRNSAAVTVARTVPDMDYICVNENRLWGCKGDTLYASKLGDPLNFFVFDGLSTDSWSAETGTPGEFTGCCSFQGYPTFFKEGRVFKVIGDEPKSFTLRPLNIVGAAAGSHKSIVEIRGKLYYVSTAGVVEWNGGDYPQTVSGELSRTPGCFRTQGARGGTDGIRYFVYLYRYGIQYTFLPDGGQSRGLGTLPHLYVYDPRFGTWHELACPSGNYAPDFAGDGSYYYMLQHDVTVSGGSVIDRTIEYNLSSPGTQFEAPEWAVTFADSTRAYKTALTGSESKKGVLRLLIRCRLAGTMKVWIAYDGGAFEEAGEFGGETGMAKGSRVVPLILRRCDFWQLRLTGTGDAVIYSIAVERYGGEWQQA